MFLCRAMDPVCGLFLQGFDKQVQFFLNMQYEAWVLVKKASPLLKGGHAA